jgi:hypothetical protein
VLARMSIARPTKRSSCDHVSFRLWCWVNGSTNWVAGAHVGVYLGVDLFGQVRGVSFEINCLVFLINSLPSMVPPDYVPWSSARQGQGPAGSEVAWHPGFPCDRPTVCHYRSDLE